MSKILDTDPQFSLFETSDPDFYIKDLSDICFQNPFYGKYHLIVLIFSGEGRIKYDLSELKVSQPSVYFFSPYQMITIKSLEKLQGKVIFFSINFYCIESNNFEISCNGPLFNNIMYYSNILLEVHQMDIFQNLFAEITQELKEKLPDRDILLSYLKLLLLKSLRLKREITENLYYNKEDRDFINKFQVELEEHFKSNHKISYYANRMNVNQSTLNLNMKKAMGMIPNIYAVMGYSENTLEAHSQATSILSKGAFNNREREAISLAVAEENGCKYCQSAHTAVAKMNGFSDEETYQLRKGKIGDSRLKSITELSKNIIQTKGNVNKETLENFFQQGFDNKALVELVALISLGTLTNYLGKITNIPIDFPVALD